MRLSRRDPFGSMWTELQQMQHEMNRLFDRWGGNGGQAPAWRQGQFQPALNIWEENETVHLEAELPGLDLKDLEIYVTGGNQLTIKGERKVKTPEKGAWHRQERPIGPFIRTLTLPFPVNSEKVEARLENGVLLIDLAKHESARPRKIPVKAE
jgi:HSP20 family protein